VNFSLFAVEPITQHL